MVRRPVLLRVACAVALRLLPAGVGGRNRNEMAAQVMAIYAAARQRGRLPACAESVLEVADIVRAAATARLPQLRHPALTSGKGGFSVFQDLRHAYHALTRQPTHALLTIATLGLGIGASSAVFSVVDTLLLRPPPFRDAHRLVDLNTRLPQSPGSVFHATPARFAQLWREQADIFEGVEYYDDDGIVLGGREPRHVAATSVTPRLFGLIGVSPSLGRSFSEDDVRTPADVAIISDALWQELGRDPRILDRTIVLDDRAHRIVGVMPPGFRFPARDSIVWRPLDLSSLRPTQGVPSVARLADNLPLALAQARADAAVAAFQDDRAPEKRLGVQLRPLGTLVTSGTRRSLWLLLGAVGFVLLIGCANAANLALTQGVARAQELSVRAALGAGRARLLRQLLLESLGLALLGGAFGVLLAHWSIAAILDMAPAEITRQTFTAITVDRRVLLFALALSVSTGLLFGSLPAWRAGRVDPTAALNQAGRSATASRKQRRIGGTLVVVEVALSLVLLSGAGLLIHSFVRVNRVNPGFALQDLLVTALQLPRERYPDGASRLALLQQVAASVRTLPGITAVTIAGGAPPGSGYISFDITPEAEGRPPVPFPSRAYLPVTPVSPDYFQTLGIPLTRGRAFTPADHNQQVVIVNETLARRYWGDKDPIGQRFRLDADEDWSTVVGVAADVRQMGYDDPNRTDMEAYQPLSLDATANTYYALIARAAGAPRTLLPAINTIVWNLDGGLPIDKASTMEALYADTLREERFYLSLMAAFALVAGALAVVGIYGVVAYRAKARIREFGVRIALGATAADLRRLVLRSGLVLVALGVSLGLAGAFWLTRLLESQLFEVTPADPATLAIVTAVLIIAALGGSYLPARRACRIDPVRVLRAE